MQRFRKKGVPCSRGYCHYAAQSDAVIRCSFLTKQDSHEFLRGHKGSQPCARPTGLADLGLDFSQSDILSSVNKCHDADDKLTLFTTSARWLTLPAGAWDMQSLNWETSTTHPVTHHTTREKRGKWRKFFATQTSNRFLNTTGDRHCWKEKSDCEPEHPGFHWFFWSLTVFDNTESYFTVSPFHYSGVCKPWALGVIYPTAHTAGPLMKAKRIWFLSTQSRYCGWHWLSLPLPTQATTEDFFLQSNISMASKINKSKGKKMPLAL